MYYKNWIFFHKFFSLNFILFRVILLIKSSAPFGLYSEEFYFIIGTILKKQVSIYFIWGLANWSFIKFYKLHGCNHENKELKDDSWVVQWDRGKGLTIHILSTCKNASHSIVYDLVHNWTMHSWFYITPFILFSFSFSATPCIIIIIFIACSG